MADLIDRQAAIDAILHNQEVYSNNFGNDPIDKYTIAIIDNDAQTIAQLPSADVQPVRHGKWMKKWHTGFHKELPCCSVCGHCAAFWWDYCPSCGARMEQP